MIRETERFFVFCFVLFLFVFSVLSGGRFPCRYGNAMGVVYVIQNHPVCNNVGGGGGDGELSAMRLIPTRQRPGFPPFQTENERERLPKACPT